MKRTYLIAVLVGVFAVGFLAADASAMYNASMGCFMQRDPRGGGMVAGTSRIAGSRVMGGGFLSRDAAATAPEYADGMHLYQYVGSSPTVALDPYGTVQWNKAVKTEDRERPWPDMPSIVGDVYTVKTNAGNTIPAWRPDDGKTYWCHGYTFGGNADPKGPFSIWGASVSLVLKDDGWLHIPCGFCKPKDDIAVFARREDTTHSGIIEKVVNKPINKGWFKFDEDKSLLTSKGGAAPLSTDSFAKNVGTYGKYKCYTRQVAARAAEAAKGAGCMEPGDNEIPAPSDWNK